MPTAISNLVNLVRQRAEGRPDVPAYVFLSGEDLRPAKLTYGELDLQARTIAALLQGLEFQGERVLLLYPPGLEFVAAFLGCIYAGVIAVPAYPPRMNRNALRLASIAEDSQAGMALTTAGVSSRFQAFTAHAPELKKLHWVATDTLEPSLASGWRDPCPAEDRVAYLQYTSGSTANPKGVMVTHGNVLHNSSYIAKGFAHTPESISLCWLPHFHDMGLIDGIIQPLYSGFAGYLMSPAAFLLDPIRWLEAISRYRVTHSGGPNFAYDLCSAKTSPEQRERLDLSSWQVAYNGAEPVHARTMEQFAEKFGPCGFRSSAFYPAYGLAEATLKVCGGKKGSGPVYCHVKKGALECNRVELTSADDPEGRTLPGSGRATQGMKVVIADPESHLECNSTQVGEIWVKGPSVARGYWHRPQETQQTFKTVSKSTGEGPFLRTGDLGFIYDGELFITGRLKDLIIIRGRNHYPQDIELTVQQCHPALRGMSGAAFAATVGTEEKLALVQEIGPRRSDLFNRIMADIQRAVAEEHEVLPYAILLLKPGAVPKTPSGKVQRHLCRQLFLEGSFQALAEWRQPESEAEDCKLPSELSADSLQLWLRRLLAAKLRRSITEINSDAPVYQLGLDSLAALELSHSIEAAMGIRLSQRFLLESGNIAELADDLLLQSGRPSSTHSNTKVVATTQPQKQHSLAQGQQALWFLQQLAPESRAYHIVRALRLKGEIDVVALHRAFQLLVERHASLRTVFSVADDKATQEIREHVAVSFSHEDASRWDAITMQQQLTAAASEPFELCRGPLFRGHLFRRSDHDHLLLLAIHHIVADLWSLGLLLNELSELYAAEVRSTPANLPSLSIQYADYVKWEEKFLSGEEGERHWQYWREQLAGDLPSLDLPVDFPRPAVQTYRGATKFATLEADLVRELKSAARAHNTTLYTVLGAFFEAFLHRYTSQGDVLVGTPTTGRLRAEFAGVIGYFVNPVVIRMDFSGEPTFEQIIPQMRRVVLEALEHQAFPFATLVQRLQPHRDSSRSPLFQAMFVFQKTSSLGDQDLAAFALGAPGAEMRLGDLHLEAASLEQCIAQFDLTLAVAETGETITAAFEYNRDLFEGGTIERMMGHFQQLLRGVMADPGRPIAEIPMLKAEERRQVVLDWNQTGREYAPHQTVLELLEQQVEKTPHHPAVIFEGRRLSYRELHEQANQLAHFLNKLGTGPEVRVGVCMERSAELVIALLGILKAGGAYVPLDPSYPAERLNYMLQDAQVRVLLGGRNLTEKLKSMEAEPGRICLEEEWKAIGRESREAPESRVTGENLAYLIYTSGSSGQPKGVMSVHKGLLNRLQWMQEAYRLKETDRVLQKTPFGFDVSVWEFLWPLMEGACLVVARGEGHKDSGYLVETIQREQVTTVHFVPSMLQVFLQASGVEGCRSLRRVISSGEALPVGLVQEFQRRLPAELHNLYGPTEASIDVSSWECERPMERVSIPIGRPIANTQLYILDPHLQPVPVGISGELYIGGVGLARGYRGRAELTAERFLPDPFSVQAGQRLYRTGDLARWRADGTIEYRGRLDRQIKLRGYRVELGEIEARLGEHSAVRECAVLAGEEEAGNKRLIAYYTINTGCVDPGAEELRAHLSFRLPEYMVPSAYVWLDSLPLTSNGKLDRKALPAPRFDAFAVRAYELPLSGAETVIAAIWADLLKVEQVGRHDNFFALGGHSLMAMTLIDRMRRSGLSVDVQAIFATHSLAELAAVATKGTSEAQVPPNLIAQNCEGIAPEMLPLIALSPDEIKRIVDNVPGGAANVQDIYPLAPLQQGIFFHHVMNQQSDPYVLFALLSFDTRERLDRYLEALQNVVERHDILRTCVLWEGLPEPVQVVQRKALVPVEQVELDDVAGDAIQRFYERFHQHRFRIDVRHAPLLRIFIAHDAVHQRWLMVKVSHHLIGDSTSLQTIFHEIQTVLAGQGDTLPAPLPFRNLVAEAQRGMKEDKHEAFFRQMLAGVERPTAPFGILEAKDDAVILEETHLQLSPDLGPRIRKAARELGVNAASLFHLAWAVVLSSLSGNADVVFGTVLSGRMFGRDGAERSAGLFINTLPMRIRTGDEGVRVSALRTYALLADLLGHEHAPLTLAQRCSAVPAPMPVFSALLNYRHSHFQAVSGKQIICPGIEWVCSEERSNYPFTLSVDDLGEAFHLVAQAPISAGSMRLCEFMQTALSSLVEALEDSPHKAVCTLDVLSQRERQQVLVEWNRTRREVSQGVTIVQMIERQAALQPQALAVRDQKQELSYQELNDLANQWACRLRKLGVQAESRVAVCMERGIGTVAAQLGVLKASAAYVPLDREHPAERLHFQINDSGTRVVITDQRSREKLRELTHVQLLCAEEEKEVLQREPRRNPECKIKAEQLAYVIYTSGSTGRPKGVEIEHRGLLNLVRWHQHRYKITSQDRGGQVAGAGFDASVWETWPYLAAGASLVIVDEEKRGVSERLRDWMVQQEITIAFLPTPLAEALMLDEQWKPQHLKTILTGGDRLQHRPPENWPLEVVNHYGPTESTVVATAATVSKGGKGLPAIGKPISNTRVYVLDAQIQPVPVGVVGELYIGGAGLARGYAGRPDLTAECFVPDALSEEPGARLYRTGDQCRWNQQGEVEFIGRKDQQVKIRGYRIEIGEIETVLKQHGDIRDAVVTVQEKESGDKLLVAYVVLATSEELNIAGLRLYLQNRLPSYMVPAAFMPLDEIPLTPSGKPDRQALKKWQFTASAAPQDPRNETEALLAQIWKDLLRVERAGIHDNFFELGGDSIISLQVVARAQQHGIRITPRQLFDSPTIAALAATAERLEMVEHNGEEKDAVLEQTYPLSPMQKGMLFESLSAPESGVYIQQLICTLRGDLDILAFQGAWQQVVQRHSVLSVSFQWERNEEPVQHVCPAIEVPFEFQNWNGIPVSEQEQQFQALLAADRARGFTLSKAPLLRLTLRQMAPGLCKSLFTFHHLILDGWSLPLLFKEVFAIYEKQVHGTNFHLPSAPPYSEYIHWLQKQDFSAAESYWRQMLQSFTAPTVIPAAHCHNGRSGFFEQQIQFSSEQTAQLQSLARQQGLTLSILVEAAWGLLLSRYSNEDDVVFGLTLSGRSAGLPHIEERIGLFINTLPVRACVHPRRPLLSWLNELQAKQAALAQYEHTPLVQVQKWSGLPAGAPLFESIVVIENYPLDASLLEQKNGLVVEDVQAIEITNYPLTVTAVPHQGLKLLITYDRGRFDDVGIARMLRHLESILLSMAASPHQCIGDVAWMTPAERFQLLHEWNQSHDRRSPQQCIHELFEEQVKRTPNEIAVTFDSGRLTYAELNQRSNQLAHYLLSAGVTPESYVGFCAERSFEMVIGILGILKAGGVYTPLDPSWPSSRKTLVLAETQALLLLTSRRLLAGLEKIDGQVICMDSEWEQIGRRPVSSPVAEVNPDNLAYAIYTSGTTGKPKGVMVSHGALCNHLRWMQAVFPLTPQDCVPQKHSLSFDVSLLEVFYPLLAGARLAIAPPMDYFDSVSLMDFLIENRITAIDLVPTMLQALLQDQRFSLLKDLRQVTCGGEVLPWDLQKNFLACSTAELANLYGPTETTIGSTFLRCGREEQHLPVSIGRPISNTQVYILDREMEPVPVSVAGELYIGGIGLARGYLHEPALTAENFVPHCHGPFPGERLYRTGDRARYRDDGNIEYLGRADHQLKIRGFRIEPGEIEAVLREHPAVREAIVLAHQQQLIAYVVGVRSAQNELRQHLKQSLPEYMVPARFIWLDKMPLLPSGKVDRKALPVPATGQASSHRDYVAPRTAVEAALATIWSAVLKAERISVDDSFFELGGDSIISLQIVARARQHGISIKPRQLFEYPSIAALAAVVERAEHTAAHTSDQPAIQGEVALTPIQRWFFEQEFAQPHHYNQAVLLEAGEELNSQWLELAWQKLVEYHDALRLRYSKEQAGWRQWNAVKEENQFFQIIEASGQQLDQTIDEMQKGLDLERGPLLRVAHVKPNLLVVVIHHLAIDGVSWRILFEDLESAYRELRQGREIRLLAKTTSYQKWAADLLQAAETARYQEELEYWLGDEWQTFDEMPKDTGSGSNREADRGCVNVELDGQQTRQLLQDVPGIYHTQINDVLLAAMLGAWQRWTGKSRLLIDLEGHGREPVIPGIDFSRTVGWFTTINPVMLSSERDDDIGQRLKTIKEKLRQVPGQGIGYGVLRYINKKGAESTRRLHQQPGAEISFNYLGQLDAALLQHGVFRSARPLEENSRGTNNQRSHLLEVEARVHRGRLQVQWIYSQEIHHRTTIELLANHFIAELSEIIQHCLAPGAGGFTPSDFPLARLDQQTLDLLIHKHSISDIYPLSPIQQGLLFHTLYDGSESGTYVEQISCSLWGRVSIEIFQQAWQQTIDHHPALRTGFIWEGFQEPLQIVHASACAQFGNHDWRPSSAGQQQRVEELGRADVQQGFDLSSPPLMRFTLIRLEPGRFEFIWTSHHLLLDGWSMALVLQEVLERYSAMCRGTGFHPVFHRPYRDYIAWIRQQDLASAEAYWRSLLRNFSTATPLPCEFTAQSGAADRNQEQQMTLSSEATARLQIFAQQHQVTLNVLIQAAWAFLLRHYSGEEDLVFGVTVSGRPAELAGVERMVGVFINTLPVRTNLASDVTVFSVLKELQEQQLRLDEYAHTPLSRIQEWSEISSGQPLFGTVVVFENYPVDASLREVKGELRFSNVRSHASTNYPLTFVVKLGEELTLQLAYDSRRYDARVVAQLLTYLNNLLAAMAADPMQRVSDLQMLSQAERYQLLVEWNHTATNYPRDKSIQQLFEEHVTRAPSALAIVFEDQKLSYEELNAQANQVAHYLVRWGVRPETRVGICMERSLEMIVALLGILKAGGGYVALEPSSPEQRLQMMLADSRLSIILTQQNLRDRLSQNPNVQIISLDEEWESIAVETRENPRTVVFGEHLAYVSYTSGSTGKPKGVSVPHRGVVRLVKNNDYARLEANEVILQFAPLTFDASTLEIWGSLLNGGRLVIMPPGPRSAGEIVQTLVEHRVTTLWLTAGLFHLMVDEQLENLAQVRQLLAGGDILSVHHVSRYLEAMRPDGMLINGYGPTENTTFTCCHTLKKGDTVQGTVPIGRPIRNTQVFVLNHDMQPVGVGVTGELYIAGAGLARGYEGDAALTAEKFVPHPYGQAGERLYRSGDQVRYRGDGTLQFIGRKDRQVKVRGYRVEPAEIEWALRQHHSVRDVVVAVQDGANRDKSLIAYVVMDTNHDPAISNLRGYLNTRLPDYMSPATFVFLEKLPLTPNGKVDYRALPRPELSETSGDLVLPRTPVEQGIAGIWKQVFGREKLCIHDNFFDLGGHSLLALQIVSRVRTVMGVALPLRSVFEKPTIADQARTVEELLSSSQAEAFDPIRPAARPHDVPLSFAQQRLWFLHQLEPTSDFYNVPVAFRVRGPLNVGILGDCIHEIMGRHEVLRTAFPIKQGVPVQQIHEAASQAVTVVDLAHLSLNEAEATTRELLSREAQQPFDLSCGPLLRLHVVRLAEHDHALLLNMHHIIVDGWSLGIFMQELRLLYEAFLNRRSSPLSPLRTQYADYALWQRESLSGERLQSELSWWEQQLSGVSPAALPTDFPRPKVQTFSGARRSVLISPQLLESVAELAHKENSTVFMLLLAVLKVLIFRYTNQVDLTIGTPVAGRNQQELESLIGFFVNTLVLRTTVTGRPAFREFLRQVRETSLGAYAHQNLPFEKLVEELPSQADRGHTPFFQIMFALEDTLVQEIVLPGLEVSPLELETQSAQFDLTVSVRESSAGLHVSFRYNTDLFEAATVERMMQHFQQLLCGIVTHPVQPISEIPMLSDEERRQILLDLNKTKRDYGANETVLQLLEQQAKETPENLAVLFEGRRLSYRQLHAAANRIAHFLKKLGVGPEARVGVCMERSAELVIALLGILKAGGAYVPLDQSYPPERLNYMLEDAQVTVLLADKNFTQKLKNIEIHASPLCLEEQRDTISRESREAPEPRATGENLAYLIYTSGSTGQPKGVMSAHRGLLNRLQWMQEAYGLNETDRVLQKTPFGFDVSVWEFFWPLMYGAVLVVARAEGHKDSRYLVEMIQQEKITTIHFVPSMLQVFLQESGVERCSSLRHVISSGDALPAPLVQEFQKRLTAELHNLYGPTEASIDVSCWDCPRLQEGQSVLIGRPIANTQLYVLDSHLQPVPVGISGELYLGGAGLARGYWRRAELTAEKFIPHPFSSQAGARLYRTGDLVRWRVDGNLEYLGRLDAQVKLRGYRIELGEIEAVLRQHPEVSQAIVALKDNGAGEKRLTAYVVSNQGTDEIREYLKSKLPEYMVPSIISVSTIPLTVNGKIDYDALPAASPDASSAAHSYVAPRNAVEEQIAQACCDLLRIQRIGIHDNFFDLGGHSLLAMRLLTWIRETFQVEKVPLRGFFEAPTVAGVAALTVKCELRPGQTEKIAKFLQQLNPMSPEEVMTLRNKTMATEAAQSAISES